MIDNIRILAHSAICITNEEKGQKIYFDPFHVTDETHDADLIMITHSHFDHYSPEDIRKVMKEETLLVIPASCQGQLENLPVAEEWVITMKPWDKAELLENEITAVPAYNVGKKFHTKDKEWLGYLVKTANTSYYVMGDTDANEDTLKVKCDVLLIPVGGTYTFTPEEAADYANTIKPGYAIPTHYGDIVGTEEDAEKFLSLLQF